MRKPGVRAGNCLLGILLINFVTGLVAFFRNGQDARAGERFQRISRLRMNHSHAKPQRVADVGEQHRYDDGLRESRYKSLKFLRRNRYCRTLPKREAKPIRKDSTWEMKNIYKIPQDKFQKIGGADGIAYR